MTEEEELTVENEIEEIAETRATVQEAIERAESPNKEEVQSAVICRVEAVNDGRVLTFELTTGDRKYQSNVPVINGSRPSGKTEVIEQIEDELDGDVRKPDSFLWSEVYVTEKEGGPIVFLLSERQAAAFEYGLLRVDGGYLAPTTRNILMLTGGILACSVVAAFAYYISVYLLFFILVFTTFATFRLLQLSTDTVTLKAREVGGE